MIPSLGFASYRVEYDERGNETVRELFDASGKPVVGTEGYSSYARVCNERGQEFEVSLFNASSPRRLVVGSERFARRTMSYDAFGHVTEIALCAGCGTEGAQAAR